MCSLILLLPQIISSFSLPWQRATMVCLLLFTFPSLVAHGTITQLENSALSDSPCLPYVQTFHLIGANIIPSPIPGARHSHFLPASFISLFQACLPCFCHALGAITTFPIDSILKLLCMVISAHFQSSFSFLSLNKSNLSNEVAAVVVLNFALSLLQPDLVSFPSLWPLDPQLAESVLESSVPSTELFAPLLVCEHSDVSRGSGKQKGY